MSVGQKKNGIWFCQYRIPDRRSAVKEYFGKGPQGKKAAEGRDLEIQLSKKKGQVVTRANGIYLDELAQHYIDYRKAEGRSQKWAKDIGNLLNNHLLPLLTHKPVDRLSFEDFLKVADYYADRSQATRNRYFDYLKAIFHFGLDHDFTTKNPLAKWKKGKEPKRNVQLTVDDLGQIWTCAAPHLKWAIEVEWELGTRPGLSELTSIKWSDVDFKAGVIHVRGTKTASSDRYVPISEDFQTRLLEMRGKALTEYVIEYKGSQVGKFRRSFKTACKKARITYDVRMYDIRHLFASVMLAGGGDLRAVSKLLGHTSTKMTADTYYHELEGEKERALSKRPQINSKAA